MKFVASEEIAMPVADVWAVLSDFSEFEREAATRGLKLKRDARSAAPLWQTEFRFRGRMRQAEIRVAQMVANEKLRLELSGKAAEADITVDLLPLGPQSCRITIQSEVRARSLAARLLLQSMRLARPRLTKRYRRAVGKFAAIIADRGDPV